MLVTDDREKLAGKSKETLGRATGDEELESEGRTQRSKEETKEKIDEARDKAKGAVEALKDKS